jgi:hypothetical protein
MSKSIDGYSLCILPPSGKGDRKWFGYAKNDNHSPLLDGGDDPTPDKVRAWESSPGLCAEAVVVALKAFLAAKS